MGKGDRRTKRGKIWRGTSGNVRPRRKAKPKAKSRPKSPRPAGKPAGPAQG